MEPAVFVFSRSSFIDLRHLWFMLAFSIYRKTVSLDESKTFTAILAWVALVVFEVTSIVSQ